MRARAALGALVAALGGCDGPPEALVLLAPPAGRGVIQRMSTEWTERTGQPVQPVYEAPAATVRLVDTGAAADLLILPRPDMERLEASGHLSPGTRCAVAADRVVLARRQDAQVPALGRVEDLLEEGRSLLIPREGPAADLARLYFEERGLMPALAPHLVEVADARALLAGLRTHSGAFALMEGSAASAEPDLQISLVLSGLQSPAPIVWEAAVTAHRRSPEAAAALVAQLCEERSRASFLRLGFASLGPERQPAPPPGPGKQPQPEGEAAPDQRPEK